MNAKLKDTWSDAYKMKADTVKCMDGWEKSMTIQMQIAE